MSGSCVRQGLQGRLVQARDQDEGMNAGRQRDTTGPWSELDSDSAVVTLDHRHHAHQRRDGHHDQIRAVGELGDQHNDQNRCGQNGASSVDQP